MSTAINDYLDSIKGSLRLEDSSEDEIIVELETHIEDEVRDLEKAGLLEEEAVKTCLRLLGSAKAVALQIYEAHSQGTWRQALLASVPHLVFAIVFFLNWCQGEGWLVGTLIAILGVSAYGWWRHKSSWMFPWLGYSLLPVVAAGLFLLYLPRGWSWLAILVYLPLALWLVIRVVSQTIKKDWLYISLMLLPMPAIIGWFLAAGLGGGMADINFVRLSYFAPGIGASFAALGMAVVTFIRLRRRWLKIAVLVLSGLITIALASAFARGTLELMTVLLLILFMVSIFLIPALLENGARCGKWGRIFEHHPTLR
jgi:hypothetical protein